MSRHAIELAEDRPYPVRILQVPATRGQLLDAGEPLCIVQWADDEVQRIVLDAPVVVDTLGVRAGETLSEAATLALVRPVEDAVTSVGGGTGTGSESEAPTAGSGASKTLLIGCPLIAAIAGFFCAGTTFRMPIDPGIGLAILATCGLGLALFFRALRKGAGIASFLAFVLACIAAGVLGGRTERTTDWLRDLPRAFRGSATETDGGLPMLSMIELPPVREGMEPAGVAEPLLDAYVWALSACALLDSACVEVHESDSCEARADALQEALPDLVPSERLEAQMTDVETPPRAAFALAEGETCEEYEGRASFLIEDARQLLDSEESFLSEHADAAGHPEWATALRDFTRSSAMALGNCNGLAKLVGDEELASWTWARALALQAAFPERELDVAYLYTSEAAEQRERRASSNRRRALLDDCRALRENSWLALED